MTETQAQALAKKLPSGWLALAQAALKAQGLSFSPGHISRVKSGKNSNQQIEEVLLQLAAEESRRRAELDQRIEAL